MPTATDPRPVHRSRVFSLLEPGSHPSSAKYDWRKVYGPRFRCRLCHGLSYECQFESRAQRANRRARKIRRRLGGSDCLMEEFPPRPRGMHWATYRRLEALEAAADYQWTAAVVARFGRSKGRHKLRRRDK